MIRQLSYTGNGILGKIFCRNLFNVILPSRHYKKKLDAHRVYVASLKRKRAGGGETRGGLNTPASLAQCKRLKIQAELGLGDQVTPSFNVYSRKLLYKILPKKFELKILGSKQ